ncbi:MAG: hypothetical protein ACYTXA_28605 [Nostoc sp.]
MSYQQMEKSIVLERRSPDDSYKDPGISTLGFIPMINALWMNVRDLKTLNYTPSTKYFIVPAA